MMHLRQVSYLNTNSQSTPNESQLKGPLSFEDTQTEREMDDVCFKMPTSSARDKTSSGV